LPAYRRQAKSAKGRPCLRQAGTPEGACITEWYYLLVGILCGYVLRRKEGGKDGPPAMVKEATLFRVGTGSGLLALALLVYAIGWAQEGPGWEVPSNAAFMLFLAPFASGVLTLISLTCALRANYFRSQLVASRWAFWLTFSMTSATLLTLCFSNPGQWPHKMPYVSACVHSVWWMVVLGWIVVWIILYRTSQKR